MARIDTETKQNLADIIKIISWSEIARQYFFKSASWLHHKINGIDGNGCPTDFTDIEKAQLRDALLDLSERIKKVAESIDPD